MPVYKKYLASFQSNDALITVPANDCEALQAAFDCAEQQGVFIESMFMEPVMGEGNPGMAATPAFYALARELTLAHGSLLLVDSIQAGLRTNGCLSVVGLPPDFENLQAPDMETYSKALNGGQYPLSVLAVNQRATDLYQKGLYGNTMTTNPRAMDVAVSVLDSMNGELRNNIVSPRPRNAGKIYRSQRGAGWPHCQRPGHRPAVQCRVDRQLQKLRRRQY